MLFPSALNCTLAMVAVPLGVAEADTAIVPETLLLFAGLVRLMVGGGVTLLTVTVTLALLLWPSESVATAVRVWPALLNVVVLS